MRTDRTPTARSARWAGSRAAAADRSPGPAVRRLLLSVRRLRLLSVRLLGLLSVRLLGAGFGRRSVRARRCLRGRPVGGRVPRTRSVARSDPGADRGARPRTSRSTWTPRRLGRLRSGRNPPAPASRRAGGPRSRERSKGSGSYHQGYAPAGRAAGITPTCAGRRSRLRRRHHRARRDPRTPAEPRPRRPEGCRARCRVRRSSRSKEVKSVSTERYFSSRATLVCFAFARPRPMSGRPPRTCRLPLAQATAQDE